MRGIIAWEIEMEKKQAVTVYEKILDKYPKNMEAYFNYWEFLKKIGEKKKLEKISRKMMKAAQDTSVPTTEWMKAHSMRAKTLIILNKHEEAINILKKQVHVIPPLEIPGLSYFKDGEIIHEEEIREQENPFNASEEAQNTPDNLDLPNGYKFSVGRSSKPRTSKNRKSGISSEEDGMIRSVNPKKIKKANENLRFSFNSHTPNVTEQAYIQGKSESSTPTLEDPTVHHEIEGFSVSTDVDFLYQIGKICAENGIKINEGIESLNDFCLILDYYHQDMDEKVYTKMKTLAKFYIGV
jgi:tetratricopeptide (TPR) repeat protein